MRYEGLRGELCSGRVRKIEYFKKQHPDLEITWHFIGHLQSNKTRPVAEHFDWVQTVERLKIAQRLSEQRPADMPPLNVLIEVHISDEESKSGCPASRRPGPGSSYHIASELKASRHHGNSGTLGY